MKKIYLYIIIAVVLGTSCNKEWTDELYINEVSFVKSGVTTVYAKYNSEGGQVTLKVPVVVSGTTGNNDDISVTIGIDKDTLADLNFDRFRLRDDLYFLELPTANYSFESMTTTIPKGSDEGYFNLNLKMQGLDMINKYILPVEIVSTSKNNVSTRKWFKKSLMQVIPFNDFSGAYSNAGLVWDRDIAEESQTALSTPTRNAWVVDENTVFFFAGIVDEEAKDRANYKIFATFNADSTVTLTASNSAINFSQQSGTYTITKRMDDVQPYLEVTDIIVTLEYQYSDITNIEYPINYRFTGTLTLEKVRNTQIPEEDQQVVVE
ncbi:MAG: DUF4973 domain-containing protein [Niabella sp.]